MLKDQNVFSGNQCTCISKVEVKVNYTCLHVHINCILWVDQLLAWQIIGNDILHLSKSVAFVFVYLNDNKKN